MIRNHFERLLKIYDHSLANINDLWFVCWSLTIYDWFLAIIDFLIYDGFLASIDQFLAIIDHLFNDNWWSLIICYVIWDDARMIMGWLKNEHAMITWWNGLLIKWKWDGHRMILRWKLHALGMLWACSGDVLGCSEHVLVMF